MVYWQWALPISGSLLAGMAHVAPQRRPSLESQLRRELGSIFRLCSPSQVCLLGPWMCLAGLLLALQAWVWGREVTCWDTDV